MKRITLLIITLIYTVGIAAAQVSFELKAPNVVATGNRFLIEFVLVNAKAEQLIPPTFTGADVLAGPVVSTGKFYNNYNGKVSEGTTVTYAYTLQATSSSKITVSAASVIAEGGKKYSTRATQIDVGQSTRGGNGTGAGGGGQQTVTGSSILLRMESNKSEVFKGEAVVASLVLYTQVGILGFEDAKLPAFNGFWKQELGNTNPPARRVTVNGKTYESQAIKQWLVYPQRAGVLEIEQCDVTAIGQTVTQPTSTGSLFESFFGGAPSVERFKRKITAPPIKIRVKELPQPQPEDFSGGVGKFALSAENQAFEVAANSGGTIKITLNGTGDLPLIDAPVIDFPNGIEKYDTKSSENISNTAGGSSGSRTWEFPFIARAEGDYTIPGITMSYFDTSTGRYATLSTGDFKIKVTKDLNPGSNMGGIVSGVTKEDLKILGQDIHYIRTGELRLHKKNDFVMWSAKFFIAFGVLIAAFILALVLLKKQIKNRADVARTKNKKANGVALRRLKKAKTFMNADNKSGFYEEMLRALWGYMGDKMTISVSDLSKERLREEFSKRGVSTENGEEFLNLIAECEMAQYSPIGTIEMDKAYNAALELIGKLELK